MENEVGLIRLGPEIHGAQADTADGEAGAAEVGELHGAEPTGSIRARVHRLADFFAAPLH